MIIAIFIAHSGEFSPKTKRHSSGKLKNNCTIENVYNTINNPKIRENSTCLSA